MKTPPLTEQLLREFEEKYQLFEFSDPDNMSISMIQSEKIKSFLIFAISNSYTAGRESVSEEIEGMKVEIPEGLEIDIFDNNEDRKIYNQALSDVLDLLK